MATDEQTPIGATVELPGNAERQYEYKSDGGEFVNLIEIRAHTADIIVAGVFIQSNNERKWIPRSPAQGDDDPDEDRPANTSEKYPMQLSNVVGEHRYTLLEELEADDRIVFRFKNTTGNPELLTFRAAAASTLQAAGAGGT